MEIDSRNKLWPWNQGEWIPRAGIYGHEGVPPFGFGSHDLAHLLWLHVFGAFSLPLKAMASERRSYHFDCLLPILHPWMMYIL